MSVRAASLLVFLGAVLLGIPWQAAAAGCPNAAQPELSTINRPFLRPHCRIGKQPKAAAGVFSRRIWSIHPPAKAANRAIKAKIAADRPAAGHAGFRAAARPEAVPLATISHRSSDDSDRAPGLSHG